MASCGIAAGARDAYDRAVAELNGDKSVTVSQTGCIGFCEEEPLVEIFSDGGPRVMYKKVTADRIMDVIADYRSATFAKKWVLGQVRDPRSVTETGVLNPQAKVSPAEGVPFFEDVPFYKAQTKIALRNCGYIDPDSIEEYIARNGYRGFVDALAHLEPAEVIAVVKESGLRGRGGGGFPTGIKWATCAKHAGERTVICNADEGDPGAYMDRSILEGDPHSVLEGMLIARLRHRLQPGLYLRSQRIPPGGQAPGDRDPSGRGLRAFGR